MGRGRSKIGGASGNGQQRPSIDTATTAQEAFDALNVGDYIELKTPGDRYSSGVWLVYQKMTWGFGRESRPGYYNMPGDSMVLIRDLSKYDGRWRKITDYARQMYNL